MANIGRVVEIRGVVVDIDFDPKQTPKVNDALTIKMENGLLTLEVGAILGDGRIRAVAMSSTYGIKRDMEVVNTGAPITVPVGKETLGRMFDVLGKPIDGHKALDASKNGAVIHREAPAFIEQSGQREVFETGIKVIDLLTPFIKGGKLLFTVEQE